MDDFDKYLKKQMDDPGLKKEWDNSETGISAHDDGTEGSE